MEVSGVADVTVVQCLDVARLLRRRILDAMRLAPRLPQLAASVSAQLGSETVNKGYVCVHLRVEDDFRRAVRDPPGYYSLDQIAAKLSQSSFPRAYPTAYLAGLESPPSTIHLLQNVFANVTSKYQLLTADLQRSFADSAGGNRF